MKPWILLLACMLTASWASAQDPVARVYFETDKDIPLSESLENLNGLLHAAQECASCPVILSGHTDDRGSDAYNIRLSQRRARAVYDYLVAHGIDADRIDRDWRGEALPAASNENDEGMALNRRVEVRVEGYAAFAAAQDPQTGPTDETLDPGAFDAFLQANAMRGAESWTFDPREDFSVRTAEGAVISVRAGTFEGDENVTLTFYGALNYGSMFLHRLSTRTQEGEVLESAGMFRVDARLPDGGQASFGEGRNVGVWLPRPGKSLGYADEEEEPEFFAFEGNHNGDWVNWELNNVHATGGTTGGPLNPVSRFTLKEPNICTPVTVRNKYPFWRRFRIWVGNAFRSIDGQIATYSNSTEYRCDSTEWYKWRKRMDEVTGLDERTRDLLAGEPAKLMASDMEYMPMVVGSFNWANCDAFPNMRPMISVTVETPTDANTRCMLLYKDRKVALGADKGQGNYFISQAPGGYKATLLVVRFREDHVEISDDLVEVERHMRPAEFRRMSHAEFLNYLRSLNEVS